MLDSRAGDVELFRRIVEVAPDAMVLANQMADPAGEPEHEVDVRLRSRGGGRPARRVADAGASRAHHGCGARVCERPTVRPMQVRREELRTATRRQRVPAEITLAPIATTKGEVILADIQDATERSVWSRTRPGYAMSSSQRLPRAAHSADLDHRVHRDAGGPRRGGHQRPGSPMLEVIERNAARELKLVEDLLTWPFSTRSGSGSPSARSTSSSWRTTSWRTSSCAPRRPASP